MESLKHLDNLKKYIQKDVESIIKILINNYDIYENGEIIDKNIVFNKLLSELNNITICNAIVNGKLCKNKCYNTSNYCKKHSISLYENNEISKNNVKKDINKISIISNSIEVDLTNYTKKVIEDSVYYIKDNFIFNSDMVRVGYIDDNEYVLTDDPFILNCV